MVSQSVMDIPGKPDPFLYHRQIPFPQAREPQFFIRLLKLYSELFSMLKLHRVPPHQPADRNKKDKGEED